MTSDVRGHGWTMSKAPPTKVNPSGAELRDGVSLLGRQGDGDGVRADDLAVGDGGTLPGCTLPGECAHTHTLVTALPCIVTLGHECGGRQGGDEDKVARTRR